jgi:hypothetical protein
MAMKAVKREIQSLLRACIVDGEELIRVVGRACDRPDLMRVIVNGYPFDISKLLIDLNVMNLCDQSKVSGLGPQGLERYGKLMYERWVSVSRFPIREEAAYGLQ